LCSLPPEIGALTQLINLDVYDNPLVTPPPEVVEQGVEAIQAYLRELSRAAEPIFEAKVVLVGEGAVGKTTLKERLIRNRFATPGSTRGLAGRYGGGGEALRLHCAASDGGLPRLLPSRRSFPRSGRWRR